MVFASHVFVFYFLTAVLALYYLTPARGRQALLTALSYLFYGWANPWFVFLMAFSTLIDYYCGLVISGKRPLGRPWGPPPAGGATRRQQRIAVGISVVTNLSLLGFFKYFPFVQENLNFVLETFGHEALRVYQVVLPLGISFYTFQSMSYSIDLYRGHARPAKNLLDFSCYVALFPQLVAGPIVRYADIAEQLSERTHTLNKFSRGVALFVMGLGKKVLLANPMGETADAAFNAATLTAHDAWMGVIAYSFQIYFDFSGYSDMAIGLGLMLGFNFPRNFDSPYLADSITDFWRRWHITLSTWLRDYLYIPLGGNRLGNSRTYVNLMLVMVLGGLWHGASWNFLIWGGIHGAMLAGERMFGKNSVYRALPRPLRIVITFAVVTVAWVFFRSPDLESSMQYLRCMFGLAEAPAGAHLVAASLYDRYHLAIFLICALIVWTCRQSWEHAQSLGPVKALLLMGLLAWTIGVMWTQAFNPFIYFIF